MKRRLITGIAAFVLATMGVSIVLAYAHGADGRALAGVASVNVYVVTIPIPKGTSAVKIPDFVKLEAVPAKAAATGSMSSLAPISGHVATVDLVPGEQLLSTRFGTAESLLPAGVVVPRGMQQVTVKLEPERALGGSLSAGDRVGVFISMPGPTATTGTTHLTLQKVLVMKVAGGTANKSDVPGAPSSATAGTTVLVTMALAAPAAEQLVYGAERGTLWLSAEGSDADPQGTRVVTGNGVYK